MYIHVTVRAGARAEAWTCKKPAYFLAAVREKAQGNQANARVRRLVADHFAVPLERVRIIHGHQSPSKLIAIEEYPDESKTP